MAVKFGRSEDVDDLDDDDGPKRPKRGLIKPRPQVVVKQCNVCMHPYRNIIDRMLALGLSMNVIESEFAQEGDHPVHRKNLANHRKKHMAYEDRAVREILEAEAKQITENVDELKATIITSRGFMRTMLMKAYQDMLDGTLKTEARDVIQMINLMEKMDEDSATIEKEELFREFNLFAKAVKAIVPDSMWNDIVAELKRLNDMEKSIVSAVVVPKNELPSGDNPLDVEVEEEDNGPD